MILPIITYPNEILTKKTKKITDTGDPQIKRLILDMLETLDHEKGLGLAAPQVGSSVRLCVIKLNGRTHVLINPKFKSKSFRKETAEEGCLSFPGMFFPVKRHRSVKVEAVDQKGETVSISADGMLSRALQHEIDHLDGILYINRNKSYKKHIKNEQ